MIHFRNDYSVGAHPAVMEALIRSNNEAVTGYGYDHYCQSAADKIRQLCNCPEAAVEFVVGGTLVNKVALSSFLRPYEAVIAAHTAHICVHETGAIESTGHKVIHCPSPDGKVTVAMIESVLAGHSSEHMVSPRLVYISNTTEVGTVYSLEELKLLRDACDRSGLLLYCDGARLGSAMTSAGADTTYADYASLCDAFTIGGAKNGLLFGEALVITNPALAGGFRSCMKQQGAILSKGWLLGVQFNAILENDLYLQLAAHANRLARRITAGLEQLRIPTLVPSPSNQIFPILPNSVVTALEEAVSFEIQERVDGEHTCVRFVTGFHSTDEDVDMLLALLKKLTA